MAVLKLCKGPCGKLKERDVEFSTKGFQRYDSFCKSCRKQDRRDRRKKKRRELKVFSANGNPSAKFIGMAISELAVSVLRTVQDERKSKDPR